MCTTGFSVISYDACKKINESLMSTKRMLDNNNKGAGVVKSLGLAINS